MGAGPNDAPNGTRRRGPTVSFLWLLLICRATAWLLVGATCVHTIPL